MPLVTESAQAPRGRELYVATFLHDIGKGRAGDHSVVGAEIAKRLCPRLRPPDEATEPVGLARASPPCHEPTPPRSATPTTRTPSPTCRPVQSPERLRLLLMLTVADIRAVGPRVWNGWKGQLLRDLYGEAASAMAGGDPQGKRAGRIELPRSGSPRR